MKYRVQRHHILLFILISFGVTFIFYQKEVDAIAAVILTIRPDYLLTAMGCILLYWILEAATLLLMLRTFEPELPYSEVLKLVMATQFFNGITPFSTGGQPFQIYVLSQKRNIDISSVTSASLHNFVVYQVVLVTMGTLAMVLSRVMNLVPYDSRIGWMVTAGYGVNLAVVAGLLMAAFMPELTGFCFKPVFGVVKRIYSDERYRAVRSSCEEKTALFHQRIQAVIAEPGLFLKAVLLNIIKLLSLYSVTYFLCLGIGITSMSLIQGIIISAYVMLITSMVPVPGATGGAELGFTLLFGAFLGVQLTAIMLLWRLVTYYIGMLVGGAVYYFGYTAE